MIYIDSFINLASSRRSIRKYKDNNIPLEDIEYFIRAATSAPSGCNSQCWKFVAVTDRNILEQAKEVVIKKLEELLLSKGQELSQDYLKAKKEIVSFFSKAPVVIFVFMTATKYYDPLFESTLSEQGYSDSEIMELLGNYDLLSIGAAIQNMLLSIHEKNYGACWMCEPVIAGKEINRILGVNQEHKFISLIPLGVPDYVPGLKKMKDMTEVFTIL